MKILSTKNVFTSDNFKVSQNTIERNGKTFTKDFIERKPIVLIIPYTADNEIYMESQFRDALNETVLEFPAGHVEGNDDLLESAKRELKEETGLTAKKWNKIADWSVMANIRSPLHIFAATDLTMGSAEPEEDEEISMTKLPLETVLEKIQKGEFKIAGHVAALLLFNQLLTEGKL